MKTLIQAGMSKIDITPQVPVKTAGMGSAPGATGVESPLYVKALTFLKDRKYIVMVGCDVLGIDEDIKDDIENRVKAKIAGGDLFITATHTHWAPHLRSIWGAYKVNQEYRTLFINRTVQAIEESLQAMEPVVLSAGKSECGLNINRRVLVDGKAFMLPAFPELTYCAQGPVDREVTVLRVGRPDGSLKGMIVNYACHPISFPANYDQITSDYPGKACALLEERYGGICLFITGAAGDLCSIGALKGVFVRDMVGKRIAESVGGLLEGGRLEPIVPVPFHSERFHITAGIREAARRHWNITLFGDRKTLELPVGIYMVGPWTGTAVGGELLVGPGLAIKRQSPCPYTHICYATNGYYGYIPAAASYPEEGYEIIAAVVEQGTAEKVVDETTRRIGQCHQPME
ncbi:MAG: neutral/alkaline non-lysosomal ceramidase N-terminal domain-containing protein [Verrucomicrobia bacterium]|nr:neutral/alkaline non-lysosomal ceramidase N-terminal domain-containing protein [Verrucomicrobiota bacterium]MBU1858144.1 neutral/alkaline non-lysosomal ceramidase N-terminal domain-containing protein [Verrucomicrobiota bacterium]